MKFYEPSLKSLKNNAPMRNYLPGKPLNQISETAKEITVCFLPI